MYNLLEFRMACPRCGVVCDQTAEFRYGLLDLHTYHVGDLVSFEHIGPIAEVPSALGLADVPGYVECEDCHKDFWVIIHTDMDRIGRVTVDESRQGYIRDDLKTPDGHELVWMDGQGWVVQT